MRVLHYIDENRLTWSEPWIQLLMALEKRGVCNCVVCRSGGTLSSRLDASGLEYLHYDPMLSSFPPSTLGFADVISRVKPDIIHTRLSSAAATGGWWGCRKKIPVVETLDKHAKIKYYKNANLLLCCSNSVMESAVAAGFDAGKISVLYNPVNIKYYKKDAIVRAKKRAELGIGSAPLIASAGRFDDGKGFELLIKAFARLHTDSPNLRLLLLGDGKLRNTYSILAEGLGIADKIVMPGFVSDVRPWFWASDIFVMPSVGPEAFGLALLEAMASELAVVAANIGGPAEIISDMENGVLFPVSDDVALYGILKNFIFDKGLIKKYSVAALNRAHDFDIDKIADETIDHYKKLQYLYIRN